MNQKVGVNGLNFTASVASTMGVVAYEEVVATVYERDPGFWVLSPSRRSGTPMMRVLLSMVFVSVLPQVLLSG